MMRKTNEGRSPAGILLPPVAAGLAGHIRVYAGRCGADAPGHFARIRSCAECAGLPGSRRAHGRFCRGKTRGRAPADLGNGGRRCGFSDFAGCGSAAAIPAGEHCPHSGQLAVRDSGFGARRSRRRQHTPQETTQSHKKVGGNYYEARIDSDLCNPEADRCPRWLRRVPDFLPVCLQDFLHGCEPEV